jgi:C-terminal processing protease CtpA/Prc
LFLLIVIPIHFSAQVKLKKESVFTRKYAPAALAEDVKVMSNVVLAMHPVIGVYKDKSYYVAFFDSLMQTMTDSMTEKQFRIQLKLAADELHCGHTEVIYSPEYYKESAKQKFNYSPYFFITAQNKVYMLASLNRKKDTLIKRGAEIVSINGIPTDSMLRFSKRFISTDGYNVTGKDHYIKLGFNTYYLSLFGRPDTFVVEYRQGDSIRKVQYPAFKAKSLPSIPLTAKDDSLFKFYKKSKMKYRFLDEEKKSMLLKIDGFSRKKFRSSYRKIFRKLEQNKSENLVIDLRNNGGGSLENSYRLLSYLLDSSQTQTLKTGIRSYPYKQYTRGNVFFKLMRFGFKLIAKKRTVGDTEYYAYTIRPVKKYHYNKKLYVLINGGSFSASCLVSAYLKYHNRATFIGEETAGALEGCNAGITPYYKLPNTKIRVRMPAFRIVHDVCPAPTGHGIIPDYRVEYTINDILRKKDLELEKVKELIGKP